MEEEEGELDEKKVEKEEGEIGGGKREEGEEGQICGGGGGRG